MGNTSSSSVKLSNGRSSKSSNKNGHEMNGNKTTVDAMIQAESEAEVRNFYEL